MINSFLVLIATSVLLLFVWLHHKRRFWKNHGITTPPYSLIYGHLKTPYFHGKSLADRTLLTYEYFKSKGLRHGGLYQFLERWYIPIDLDIIKSIMQSDFQHFTDKGGNVIEGQPLTGHLLNLKGKKWKLMRAKLTPTFTSGKMKMMFGTLMGCTDGLYRVMDENLDSSGVDIKDILGRFTTDVIGRCAFGLECNSLKDPDNEFRKKGKACFQRQGDISSDLLALLTLLAPSPIRKLIAYITFPKDISNFFMGVVRDTITYREKNNVERNDLMQLLIQLKNKGKLEDDEEHQSEKLSKEENKITVDEIAAQAFIFFAAGFETSSTTMTFCLYELARNKVIQDKLRREITDVLRKYNNEVTYEAIMEMTYLDKTINESLRKYPPGVALRRICTKNYNIPGTDIVLEKGTRVLLPVIAIQRDPEYYPDPEKFDPERFSEEEMAKRHDFAFLAFGGGPRMCIGLRFGMMQAKVGLVTLLRRYEFDVGKKTKEPLKWDPGSFILSTYGEMWLKYRKL